MMRDRLRWSDRRGVEQVVQSSALDIPWSDATFDAVVSIGCLHHTGNLERSNAEVHRVLKPGGVALVMLYNKRSFGQLAAAPRRFGDRLHCRDGSFARSLRARYDADSLLTNVAWILGLDPYIRAVN
jgi:SAM-dependent methyltransferase